MKNLEEMNIDKKKELNDKKRYDQINKNYNQQSLQMPSVNQKHPGVDDQGQAGSNLDENAPKLDAKVQLNLENLTKIDEKLQNLSDNLK